MDNVERFPDVEKVIIETLMIRGRVSDYSTLQDLLPGVSIHEFLMSMCHLQREGKVKEGDLKEVGCFVNVENTLVPGTGVAKVVSLVKC